MTTALTFLILIAPFAVAAALSWAAHRSDSLRIRFDQFRWSAPMIGRLFEDDRDGFRVAHDVDAIRTRFEQAAERGPPQARRASVARNDSTACDRPAARRRAPDDRRRARANTLSGGRFRSFRASAPAA